MISRRHAILGGSGLLLAGCDRITASPTVRKVLTLGETATMSAQRLVMDRNALAPEFTGADRSPVFRTNGNTMPAAADFARHLASGFAEWRLAVEGLVANPLQLGLADLRAAPQRTQTTRHDCVEGWSAIAEWTGVPLGLILKRAGLRPQARYLVFHCADDFGGAAYYESIDLVDAFHPQTILAHALNGQPLPVGNGAPLRLRVERQLGYKHAKFVMRIEAVESLAGIHGGKGGYWEDSHDYQWYAGI
jgi:DMSO/TMAO reductase YedYZ molybdopterin-dependent catalytic subunit